MSRSRLIVPVVATISLLGGAVLSSGPAAASTVELDLNDTVQATTTLATLNQTITLSTGTFHGVVYSSGKVKGHMSIPDTKTRMELAGIGLANVTLGLAPTKAVTGTLNVGAATIKAVSTQYLLVKRVSPLGLPVNLVGSHCKTSVPVPIHFVGQIAPTGVTTVSGTYTIPSFANCQGLDAALDLAVSGSGNTFSAILTPTNG